MFLHARNEDGKNSHDNTPLCGAALVKRVKPKPKRLFVCMPDPVGGTGTSLRAAGLTAPHILTPGLY